MSTNHMIVELDHQPIELCKLLKVANLVAGGGEAKIVISEGYVLLNGEVEYQKRKKIYHEDVIEFNGDLLQVIINEDLADEPSVHDVDTENVIFQPDNKQFNSEQMTTKSNKKKTKNKVEKLPESTEVVVESTPRKRRPISF